MKPHVIAIFLVASLISFSSSNAQPAGVSIQKKSSWVESVTYNAQAKPVKGQESSYYYLLLDEQENATLQEDYFHYAYSILTSEGLQEMSDLSFDFDPAYQQLILHEIKLIRGNTIINQLSKNIKVIQREQSMDRYLYDGTKTAIINLADMRVGDIVEYSFTRKGYNPVHKGHIARTYYFDFYQGIEKYYKKLIVPASKKLDIKTLGENVPQAVSEQIGNVVQYSWELGKTEATQYDSNTPAWYNTSQVVMISDFTSWREVGDWAKELFALRQADRDKIKNEVAPTFKAANDTDYILEVIHFVQDEVRYLGFESGINSHKPYPPVQVYEQRFGDCKDKSLLLTTLLHARNIEAYPMLVNTSLKHALDDRLPSGNIFDHCVVAIVFNDKKIYVDPTWSNQGGDLDHYYFPDYRRGLVIDEDISGLDSIPPSETPTTTEVQNFEVLTIGGEAMLTVKTTYTGSNADYQRAEFARTPLETTQKNYKQYYANLYPDITNWEDITYHDDRLGNVFTVEEKYKIPTFWKATENDANKLYCVLQPQSITNYFDVPKNIQQRKSPYALSYPVDFYHHIHVSLPQEWTISPVDEIIENEFYQYEHKLSKEGNEVTKMTHYQTKDDYIPAEKISEYISDHTKMYNQLVYELSWNKSIAEASNNTLPGVITSLACIIVAAYIMLTLYHRYNPKPARYMVVGSPIGGWLVLISIGLILTPFLVFFSFITTPELLTGTGWMLWWSAKRYDLFAFAFFTHIYNIFKLLFSVLLIILFFQRRTSFPQLMCIQLAMNFIVLTADTIVARAISDDPSNTSYKDAIQAFFGAAIWIPYLNLSQRVKETFVIQIDKEEEDSNVEESVQALEGSGTTNE